MKWLTALAAIILLVGCGSTEPQNDIETIYGVPAKDVRYIQRLDNASASIGDLMITGTLFGGDGVAPAVMLDIWFPITEPGEAQLHWRRFIYRNLHGHTETLNIGHADLSVYVEVLGDDLILRSEIIEQ